MNTYQYETNSNAAPFVSDYDHGFIEAESPMEALKKVVKEYDHPSGLYSAVINKVSTENEMLARYLSPRAATSACGESGLYKWEEGSLYVNGKKVDPQPEKWEEFKN